MYVDLIQVLKVMQACEADDHLCALTARLVALSGDRDLVMEFMRRVATNAALLWQSDAAPRGLLP
jgi:hypothetical protein